MTIAAMTTTTTVTTTPMAICEPLLRPELAGVNTLTPAAVFAGCVGVAAVGLVIAGFVAGLLADAVVDMLLVVGLVVGRPVVLAGGLADTVLFVVVAVDCDDVLGVDSCISVAVTDGASVESSAAGVAVKDEAVEVIFCSCVSLAAVSLVLATVAISLAVLFAV